MFFFFFNDTATTEIYTLSLHDALPISERDSMLGARALRCLVTGGAGFIGSHVAERSEEHTSELQSQSNLVCRLLLEKKKHGSRHCMHASVHSMGLRHLGSLPHYACTRF